MSAEIDGTDQWYHDTSTVTPTSDLTITNAEWYDGSYHSDMGTNNSYAPPNMIYGLSQPAITAQSLTYLRNDFTGGVGFAFTTASGTPVRQMQWTLDATGNWSQYLTKTSGTTDLSQSRTSNTVNEITAISESTGPTWVTPAYDAAGNTTTMPQVADPTHSFTAAYDAWNRMVSISASGTVVAQYRYDGRNRRVVKLTYASGVLSETRHFYFSNAWQDVEERTGTSTSMDKQYVWGVRYVDELVCRDDATPQRLYAWQDANFNLTAITNTGGTVQERYRFDPYGGRTLMDSSWGVIASSSYDWAIGYQGLPDDEESGLTCARARKLHPLLGRWTQQEPIGSANLSRAASPLVRLTLAVSVQYMARKLNGFDLSPPSLLRYAQGASLYEALQGRPTIRVDPTGMFCGVKAYQGDEAFGHAWLYDSGNYYGFYPNGNMLVSGGHINTTTWSQDSSHGYTEWGTDLLQHYDDYVENGGPAPTMRSGNASGKRCDSVSCADIDNCIKSKVADWGTKHYILGGQNCRDFVDDALGSCCLQKGNSTSHPPVGKPGMNSCGCGP